MRKGFGDFGLAMLVAFAGAGVAVAQPPPDLHLAPPVAQMIATVNGIEITTLDVDTELAASNAKAVPGQPDPHKVALEHLVDRALLVSALPDRGKPGLTGADKRTDQTERAQAYARQLMAALPAPTDDELGHFIAAHPDAFDDRQLLSLDQIRFTPKPEQVAQLNVIAPDHTMAAVMAHLDGLGIKYEHSPVSLDTARIPGDLVQLIYGLPPGEPFVLPTAGMITISVLAGRQSVPADPAATRALAEQGLRGQKLTDALRDKLKALRAAAKISYAPGYAPS